MNEFSNENPTPNENQSTDASGTGTTQPQPELLDTINRASDGAIHQFEQEQPKPKSKRGGKREGAGRPSITGKYSKSKDIPVGDVGNGPGSASGQEGPASSDSNGFQNNEPDFDAETARAVIEGLLEVANSSLGQMQRTYALSLLRDEAAAERAAQAVQCPPKLATAIVNSGVKCWEIYAAELKAGPEVILAGCGLGWAAMVLSQRRTIKEQSKKLVVISV